VARYHPIYEGLWDDAKLEGLSFECHGFFAFLCSNKRCCFSGIYRATDGQLAQDSGLPVAKVRTYLDALATRSRIVRDGAWIFLRGYLERQPNHPRFLKRVVADLHDCSSETIQKAFFLKYPLLLHPMQALGFKMSAHPQPHPQPHPQKLQKQGTPASRGILGDDEFLAALKANPAYQNLDIGRELGKLDAWLLTPRGRGKKKTRGRIFRWLNQALEELPMDGGPEEPYGVER